MVTYNNLISSRLCLFYSLIQGPDHPPGISTPWEHTDPAVFSAMSLSYTLPSMSYYVLNNIRVK